MLPYFYTMKFSYKQVSKFLLALSLGIGSFYIYTSPKTLIPAWDTRANVEAALLPFSASLHLRIGPYSQREAPWAFRWQIINSVHGRVTFPIRHWEDRFLGKTFEQQFQAGKISSMGEQNFVVQAKSGEDGYADTFGPVPGLVASPLIAIAKLFLQGGNGWGDSAFWVGRYLGAFFVSISVAAVFLISVQYLSIVLALLITVCFAFGTSAWSILSQGFWLQSVTVCFIGLGLLFYVLGEKKKRYDFLCGLFLGLAAAARMPNIAILATVILFLLWEKHFLRALYIAILGFVPIGLLLLYNSRLFGSPWLTGQMIRGHLDAVQKTGSPDLWSTPMLTGLVGNLVSPSRGLLIYSPVLIFGLVGIVLSFRDKKFIAFRPLGVAFLVQLIVAAKWFDWWGGWTYGNSNLADATLFLLLSLVPFFAKMGKDLRVILLFLPIMVFSIYVHWLGAYVYDDVNWNNRTFLVSAGEKTHVAAHKVNILRQSIRVNQNLISMDINNKEFRNRLWDWKDNPIYFYATHADDALLMREQFSTYQ